MSTSPPPRGPLIENRRTMKLRVESLPTNIRRLRRDVRLDHIGLLFPERRVSLAKKYNLYHYIDNGAEMPATDNSLPVIFQFIVHIHWRNNR